MSRLALNSLGAPRIERGGEPVTVDRRKALALVAYLAVTGRNHSRDALATLFWPEHDQSRAHASLRSALASLKKALGEGWLDADRETAGLNPDAEVWLDVGAFQDRLAECRTHGHPEDQVCPDCLSPLAEAAALYGDDFLTGFTLRDSPGFDEWQFFQTEGLREDLGSALRRLAQGHSEQGEYERAIAYARHWVALDPLHEPAHRRLMRLYAWAGQRAAALRQYGECERVLQEELGLPLEEETAQLYQAIQERRELPTPVDRAVVPVTAEPPAPRHNLPVQLTPFVGREGVLAEIGDRLQDPDCRLLTLVGPGGSGKTRLALEAAAAQLERYPHGVFFVRLAALDSAEAIVPAVAKALGFSFYTEAGDGARSGAQSGAQQRLSPRQQLLDYLHQKTMLLIMDNFEHLLDGVELVTDVLKTAPKVKILATSRARMNVQGEHLFPVAGMDFPTRVTARDARGTPEDAAQYSAVRLFLQSGRRVQPDLKMTTDNLTDVVRICRVVAGMPLGILLAAGWVRMLTLAEIATEIGHSLDFLETDQHDLPERQRSMRAVFDHSWNLLTARERAVMQALSVFRGGFTREAAKRVTGATLHELRALVDKSLLQRDPGGRYEIHELLRQYAAEQLGGARAEEETARDCHSAYYAGFLQGRQVDLMGRNQRRALAEIEAEIENVRAGWNWAVAQGKVEEIDRALESLAEFYWIRAWFQEGEETFARAAQRLAAERSETANRQSRIVLGKVLMHQGRFCDPLGLAEKGRELLQKSLAIFRDLGARREMAYALCYLGGKPLCQEALAIFKEIGDRKGIALSLEGLAWTAIVQGEYGAARQLFQESLAIFRELATKKG